MQEMPQLVPEGSREQLLEVAVGPPATQLPEALQVLAVMVPASVPESEQGWLPGGTQVPLQTVLVPHGRPFGL